MHTDIDLDRDADTHVYGQEDNLGHFDPVSRARDEELFGDEWDEDEDDDTLDEDWDDESLADEWEDEDED